MRVSLVLLIGLLVACGGNTDERAAVQREPAGIDWLDADPALRNSPKAVSGDGRVVVGATSPRDAPVNPSMPAAAFRWAGGMTTLFDTPPGDSWLAAVGVSEDGSAAALIADMSRAWRWNAKSGLVNIGDFGATGISANGSVVIGVSTLGPIRWTEADGSVPLVSPPPGSTDAVAVNRDGTVIVGRQGDLAYRWSNSSGLVTAASPYNYGTATDVSADGSTVVGYFYADDGTSHVFRWKPPDDPVEIEIPAMFISAMSSACSSDASVIVGGSTIDQRAWIWDETHGMRYLSDALAALGVDVGAAVLARAVDVSADGRVVVGEGVGPNGETAFRAVLP